MKVLMVTTLRTGYRGGGNISADLLVDLLRRRGIEVESNSIRTTHGATRLDTLLRLIPEGFFNIYNPVLDLLIRWKLRRLVKGHSPDIVDLQDTYLITAAAGKDLGVPMVITVIDDLSGEQLRRSHRPIKRLLLDIKRRHVLRRIRHEKNIVTNSLHVKSVLEQNGVDPLRIRPMYKALPPEGWYAIPAQQLRLDPEDGVTRFLAPGRIARGKGITLIVDAVDLLNRKGLGGNFRVLIVGRGSMEGWLREELLKREIANLAVEPPVPIDEMLDKYLCTDVVLLPTVYREPFGRVALEAIALGRPVISSMLGGVTEIFSTCPGSYLRADDSSQLAGAMEAFIEDRNLAVTMNRNILSNLEEVRSVFSHRKLTDEYLDLYSGIFQQCD